MAPREFESDKQGGEFSGIHAALFDERFERQRVARREESEQPEFVGVSSGGRGLGPECFGILAQIPHQFAG